MSILILLLGLVAIGYLIFRMSKKRGPSKYDRKAQSPWNSLSNGEDPTL